MRVERSLIIAGVTTVVALIVLVVVGVWGLRQRDALRRSRAHHESFCLKVENSLHEFGRAVQTKRRYLGPLPDTLFRVAAKHCLPPAYHHLVDSRFERALEEQHGPNDPTLDSPYTGLRIRHIAGTMEYKRTGQQTRALAP